MKNRLLNRLWTRLYQVLGGSGLALTTACLVPSAASAATLIWNPGPNNWLAGNEPTFNGAINFFTVEQVFPENGTLNGVRIRIRLTPLANDAAVTNAPGILSSTNAPAGEDRFNTLSDMAGASGGANPQSSLSVGWAGTDTDNVVRIDFIYEDLDGNPIAVENAAFAIIDVDTDATNQWQDQVTVLGYNQATPVLPGTLPVGSVGVTLSEVPPPLITTLAGPNAPAYTITGNTVTGNPNAAAPNAGPDGNVFATYAGAITQARFDYGYGPVSAGPNPHGIGFFNFAFSPVLIGTAKEATNVVNNPDGTATITYRVLVENFGEVDLQGVQATEDLRPTFANAQDFTVTDVRLVGTTGTGAPAPNINPGFDGETDFNLLDGAGTLSARVVDNTDNSITTPGGTVTVEFDVTLTPGPGPTGLGPFENQVTATGTSPSGTVVTDESTDGANPDANGDGSPADNEPTVVNLSLVPAIGAAKAVATPVNNGDGTFTLTYTVVAENVGGIAVTNVRLTEDLDATFAEAESFEVVNGSITLVDAPAGSGIDVNPNFTGTGGDTELLNGTGTLAPTERLTVSFAVIVDPDETDPVNGAGPFLNQVTVTATGPNGEVTDESDDGSEVDADGDGNPNEPGENDPTGVTLNAQLDLRVIKRISGVFRNGAALNVLGIDGFNDQPNTDDDNGLNNAFGAVSDPAGLFLLPTGFELEPGDQVEYTIYLWNNGNLTANNAFLCDELQPPSVLDSNTFALQAVGPFTGSPTFTDPVGTLIQARNPLEPIDGVADPLESGCSSNVFPSGPPGPADAGGGVVAGPFTVPANQYGAIRFRVTVP